MLKIMEIEIDIMSLKNFVWALKLIQKVLIVAF